MDMSRNRSKYYLLKVKPRTLFGFITSILDQRLSSLGGMAKKAVSRFCAPEFYLLFGLCPLNLWLMNKPWIPLTEADWHFQKRMLLSIVVRGKQKLLFKIYWVSTMCAWDTEVKRKCWQCLYPAAVCWVAAMCEAPDEGLSKIEACRRAVEAHRRVLSLRLGGMGRPPLSWWKLGFIYLF